MTSDEDNDNPNDGWSTYNPPPEGADGLHVHWHRGEDGRWVADGLYLHGAVLTPAMLRAISLPRMESKRNRPRAIPEKPLVGDKDRTVGSLRYAAAWLAQLGAVMDAQIVANRQDAGMPPYIGRPDGSNPEAFYRRVADAYRHYTEQTKAPAKAIADEAQVPVTTVHRWVREARQRGFLPQGRRGKAG